MILGVGIDIVDLAGFREQLADPASSFEANTFTARERSEAKARPSNDPARHLAARWAAKEAFIKAWSTARWGRPPAIGSIRPLDIEVIHDAHGRPRLQLHGDTARATQMLSPSRTHLSLSHDGGYASAVVILESTAGADK